MKKFLLFLSIMSFGLIACGGGSTPSNVDSVALSESTLILNIGENHDLTATIALKDDAVETDKGLTVSVSDETLISLPKSITEGVPFTITALASGVATLTVKTVEGNKTATCEITINEAPATKTLYFSNNQFWSGTINYYVWVDGVEASELVTWPGNAMTFVETNDFGEDVYSCDIANTYNRIIFNNGSEQTADIPLDGVESGTGFYVTSEAPFYGTYTR